MYVSEAWELLQDRCSRGDQAYIHVYFGNMLCIVKGSLGGETSVLRTFRMSGKELVKERVSASPNLDDLPLRCDGCETVSCVVGSCSDHGRIMVGSVPHCKWGFTCVSCICGRQNSIVICNSRIVPAM